MSRPAQAGGGLTMDSTYIIIESQPSPAEIRELFDHCRQLIGAKKRHRWNDGPSATMPGCREYAMLPGQGLPLWLQVCYTTVSPIACDDPEQPAPKRWVQINLHRGGDHVRDRMRDNIGAWLTTRGWTWQWQTDDTPWRRG